MGTTDWLGLLLQTSDPLFPIGSYAHSFGLEEMVSLGMVHDEATLGEFLRDQILPALQNFELPLLRFAHQAAAHGDLSALCHIDSELDAWKIGRELREASLQMGSRRLPMLLKIAPTPLLEAFAQRNSSNHHLVIFAAQMAQAPLEAALTAYLYQTVAAFCSAALKLIRIGQEGCQRVLADCLASAGAVIEGSKQVGRQQAGPSPGWFNPLLEIASMRHEFAFERLFIS